MLFAVLIYNLGSSQFGSWVHSHVEGTVSHKAETTRCIFQLAGRNSQIKKRTANAANAKLIQNTARMPEIHLPRDEASAETCQAFADVPNCIGILI